ncbi:MAG: cysteine desulfurase [Deltaproteobacteria bacterium]|nr:cysteine desulfurase [Deltaproteobacteria bacterium]
MSSAATAAVRPPRLDVERLRADFPILHQQVHGQPLVYLDNAASAQKPRQVIDAVARFDAHDYANIHRGVHALSQRATDAFEAARDKVRGLLNAADRKEIIFTRGTTESINLVAHSYARASCHLGDEIVVSAMEHHSNIVPWQLVCRERAAVLRVVPMNDAGELDLDAYDRLLGPHTKLVALVHVSNALGTINPVAEMIRLAHAKGIPVLLDGAQAVPHLSVDVQTLDADFYAFSSHKLFGPSGVGVLYGKAALLDAMPPYQGGGEMISAVTFEKSFFKGLPAKFEAGTPNITGVVGLGAAIDYVQQVGLEAIGAWEHELLEYGTARLAELPQVRLIGTARDKASVLSFVIDGIHPHDIGTILDREGIAVRTGHHCAQPVMQRLGIPATTRASLAFYNTKAEVDRLIDGLRHVIEVFA